MSNINDSKKTRVRVTAKASKRLQAELEKELEENEDTGRNESTTSDGHNNSSGGEDCPKI